jgi:CRP/FNR family transcriptional regulator
MNGPSSTSLSVVKPAVTCPAYEDVVAIRYQSAPFPDLCHFLKVMPVPKTARETNCMYTIAKAGTCIHRQGEILKNIYVVVSGAAKTSFVRDEDEFISGFALSGDIIGLDGVDGMTNVSTTIAVTDSLLLSVPYAELLKNCKDFPAFNRAMINIYADRIADTTLFMEVLAKARKEAKVAFFLTSWSIKLGTPGSLATDLDFILSRRDIADYLGIAYETLSRVLSEFCDMGMIQLSRNKLRIIDAIRLHRICSAYTEVLLSRNRR